MAISTGMGGLGVIPEPEMTSSEHASRAQRLGGYFDLQLDFAGRMATLTNIRIEAAVGLYTNLRIRMALGDEDSVEDAAEWRRYLAGLAASRSPADRLDWAVVFFADCPSERPPRGRPASAASASRRRTPKASCASISAIAIPPMGSVPSP